MKTFLPQNCLLKVLRKVIFTWLTVLIDHLDYSTVQLLLIMILMVVDRSEMPGANRDSLEVSGNQKLLGSPVIFSLSWLQSVSWEVLYEGAQMVVCSQGVDTITLLSVVSVWAENLCWVRFISFAQLSIHFVFSPLMSDSNFTFGFWVQRFLLVYHFNRTSGWLWVLFPAAYIHKHAPRRSKLHRDDADEIKWQEQVMRFLFSSSRRLFMISSF